MASNGSYFMITWIIFKNHLLEVTLTQNRKTMALRTLTTVDLLCLDKNSFKSHLIEGLITYDFTLLLKVRDTLHGFGGGLGTAFGHFPFGLSQFHAHGSWLVCEVTLTPWFHLLHFTNKSRVPSALKKRPLESLNT
jgi:hypothetical protein